MLPICQLNGSRAYKCSGASKDVLQPEPVPIYLVDTLKSDLREAQRALTG
jgi:hypothetical protein